jgi:hypothetical protein
VRGYNHIEEDKGMTNEEIEEKGIEMLRAMSVFGNYDEGDLEIALPILRALISQAYGEMEQQAEMHKAMPRGLATQTEGRAYVTGYDVACDHLCNAARRMKDSLSEPVAVGREDEPEP